VMNATVLPTANGNVSPFAGNTVLPYDQQTSNTTNTTQQTSNTTSTNQQTSNVSRDRKRRIVSTPATLTVTSSNDSKTSGSTANLSLFTVSGFQAGVPTVVSGTPGFFSAGAAATANAGAYAIIVSQGTLTAPGYNFVFNSTGLLTVNPQALTITANNAVTQGILAASSNNYDLTFVGSTFVVNANHAGMITPSSAINATIPPNFPVSFPGNALPHGGDTESVGGGKF
jgi:hypothetical protein